MRMADMQRGKDGILNGLDPQAAQLLKGFRESGAPRLETLSPQEARRQFAASRSGGDSVAVGCVEDVRLTTDPAVDIRIYRPEAERKAVPGSMIFFHGGGWVLGDLDSHDRLCRRLCRGSGVTVVSVDYALSPEAAFPDPLFQCAEAVRWIHANGDALGIETNDLVFAGDSAGGNMAASLSLMAAQGDLPRPKLQALFYPCLDLTDPGTGIAGVDLIIAPETMEWFYSHYVQDAGQRTDWRASPLRAQSVAEVAPAYILTAGFDLMCGQGRAFAERLRDAGVAVEHDHAPGQIHAFLTMGDMTEAHHVIESVSSTIRRRLRG